MAAEFAIVILLCYYYPSVAIFINLKFVFMDVCTHCVGFILLFESWQKTRCSFLQTCLIIV